MLSRLLFDGLDGTIYEWSVLRRIRGPVRGQENCPGAQKGGYEMKRLGALLLTGCMLFALAACNTETRSSGELYEAEGFEQSLSTAFFDFQVNSASLVTQLEEYEPSDPNNRFLVVNITVQNTFTDDSSIPMFDTDFVLSWPDLGEDSIYCEDNFASTQLPEEYEIFKGESRTGDLVFVVPSSQTSFTLEYLEIYEDEFEGNTFKISFDAQQEAQ